MGVVVHRVDAPLVARAVVFGVDDAVHDGVAEEHVGVRHVDFRTQHLRAVGELAALHPLEEVEVLLHRAVAPRRRGARYGDRAAVLANLLLGLVVDVGQPLLDEEDGPLVELVEVVRRVALQRPVEAEPVDVALDGVDILDILLDGVRVVEAQVALAAVFLCQAEVDADALGVADVQIAVRLGREAGLNLLHAAVGQRFFDNLLEKVQRLLAGFGGFGCCHNI